MVSENSDVREVLTGVSKGEGVILTLDRGEPAPNKVQGVVTDVDVTDYPGEHRTRKVDVTTASGEFTYNVAVDLETDADPRATRTTFRDTAAALGRLDIPEDEVEDPDAYEVLDEGRVTDAEPWEGADDE